MVRRVKTVMLDFDGTLVDTEPLHFEANAAAFRRYGHIIDERSYYLHWSLLGEGPAGEIRRHGLKNIPIAQVRETAKVHFKRLIQTQPVPALPGAAVVLRELPRRGYTVMIVSNTDSRLIRTMMRRAGLDSAGIPVIGGETGSRGKPAPDIYLTALKRLEADPNECLAVEDSRKGLDAAKTAGISCVLVRYPKYPSFDTTGALRILKQLDELLSFLEEIE